MIKKIMLKLAKYLDTFKYFVLNWIWQLPQNCLGLLYKNITNAKSLPNKFNTVCKLYTNVLSCSVSLGRYVFLSETAQKDNSRIEHEFGHCKQSILLGPFYIIIVSIPSFIWDILYCFIPYINKKYSYYDFYTEKWANDLI